MVRLSNRQYPMLHPFALGGPGYHMTIHEAQRYDQRPFRSMLIQEWIAYRPGRGFHITAAGRAAWEQFHSTSIHRLFRGGRTPRRSRRPAPHRSAGPATRLACSSCPSGPAREARATSRTPMDIGNLDGSAE